MLCRVAVIGLTMASTEGVIATPPTEVLIPRTRPRTFSLSRPREGGGERLSAPSSVFLIVLVVVVLELKNARSWFLLPFRVSTVGVVGDCAWDVVAVVVRFKSSATDPSLFDLAGPTPPTLNVDAEVDRSLAAAADRSDARMALLLRTCLIFCCRWCWFWRCCFLCCSSEEEVPDDTAVLGTLELLGCMLINPEKYAGKLARARRFLAFSSASCSSCP